jgi:hypothetical protein
VPLAVSPENEKSPEFRAPFNSVFCPKRFERKNIKVKVNKICFIDDLFDRNNPAVVIYLYRLFFRPIGFSKYNYRISIKQVHSFITGTLFAVN